MCLPLQLVEMNEFKAAWYANTLVGVQENPAKKRKTVARKQSKMGTFRKELIDHQKAEAKRGLVRGGLIAGKYASAYAARSTATGALGTALRVGGRVGLRVIPIVGYAIIAYDVYQFGKWVMED